MIAFNLMEPEKQNHFPSLHLTIHDTVVTVIPSSYKVWQFDQACFRRSPDDVENQVRVKSNFDQIHLFDIIFITLRYFNHVDCRYRK